MYDSDSGESFASIQSDDVENSDKETNVDVQHDTEMK